MARDAVEKLHQWALIADSIASVDLSHERRQRYIGALINMVDDYQQLNRPIWQETLITLLEQAKSSERAYSHTEVRCLLRVFFLLCHHIADNYEKWWLAWAKETEDESTKPPKRHPFEDYFDADEELDEDDTQS